MPSRFPAAAWPIVPGAIVGVGVLGQAGVGRGHGSGGRRKEDVGISFLMLLITIPWNVSIPRDEAISPHSPDAWGKERMCSPSLILEFTNVGICAFMPHRDKEMLSPAMGKAAP